MNKGPILAVVALLALLTVGAVVQSGCPGCVKVVLWEKLCNGNEVETEFNHGPGIVRCIQWATKTSTPTQTPTPTETPTPTVTPTVTPTPVMGPQVSVVWLPVDPLTSQEPIVTNNTCTFHPSVSIYDLNKITHCWYCQGQAPEKIWMEVTGQGQTQHVFLAGTMSQNPDGSYQSYGGGYYVTDNLNPVYPHYVWLSRNDYTRIMIHVEDDAGYVAERVFWYYRPGCPGWPPVYSAEQILLPATLTLTEAFDMTATVTVTPTPTRATTATQTVTVTATKTSTPTETLTPTNTPEPEDVDYPRITGWGPSGYPPGPTLYSCEYYVWMDVYDPAPSAGIDDGVVLAPYGVQPYTAWTYRVIPRERGGYTNGLWSAWDARYAGWLPLNNVRVGDEVHVSVQLRDRVGASHFNSIGWMSYVMGVDCPLEPTATQTVTPTATKTATSTLTSTPTW